LKSWMIKNNSYHEEHENKYEEHEER